MKKTTKKLLAGILGSTLALSVTANAITTETPLSFPSNSAKVQGNSVKTPEIPVDFLPQELETKTLSTQQLRSAYFDFYQTHGISKAADVFYNGEKMEFVDAFPLIESGTTYIPLALFAETIGAEVRFIEETFSVGLEYKGDSIFFDINDSGYYVNDGERQELPFPTFTANSRTMVPLRFITEVFGLNLYWNNTTHQVIAVNPENLNTNHSFTLMDSFFDFLNGETENSNVEVTGTLNNTMTANGKTMTTNVDLYSLTHNDLSGMTMDMDVSMDLSQFEDEILAMLNSMTLHPQDAAEMASLLAHLSDFNLNYKFDLNNMEFYLQSDLISDILPSFVVPSQLESDIPVDVSTWYQLSLGDFVTTDALSALTGLSSQGATSVTSVLELMNTTLELARYYDNHEVNAYILAQMLLTNSADRQFVAEGNDYRQVGTITTSTGTMTYDFLLLTDGNEKVIGYEYQLNGGDNTLSLSLSQHSWDKITVTYQDESNGIQTKSNGTFQIAATETVATLVPDSNVLDLINLF